MKTKILVLALVLGTVATVTVYPTIRGNAAGLGSPPAGPIIPSTSAKVDVVFVLDTTGSMGGLIEAAKEKIWSIASTLAQAQQAPEIRMGLVAYRDRGDAYVTQVVDLTKDLDSMYATLMQFAAAGGGDGPESVNRALYDAVHSMSWSQDPNAYKVVFLVGDAPPHMDYQDDVKYPEVVAAARAKGIVVNTIQCGDDRSAVAPWRHIAALGQGRYFTVDQAGSAVAIATPYDDRLAALAAELDATRIYYGNARELEEAQRKLAATDEINVSASAAARARRAAYNATASGLANLVGDKELVQDVASGRVELAKVPKAELPPALAALPPTEQSALVAQTAAKREELQRQIAELAAERDAFIAKEVEARGGAADSLDQQIYEAVREQAAPVGLSYDRGAKF